MQREQVRKLNRGDKLILVPPGYSDRTAAAEVVYVQEVVTELKKPKGEKGFILVRICRSSALVHNLKRGEVINADFLIWYDDELWERLRAVVQEKLLVDRIIKDRLAGIKDEKRKKKKIVELGGQEQEPLFFERSGRVWE